MHIKQLSYYLSNSPFRSILGNVSRLCNSRSPVGDSVALIKTPVISNQQDNEEDISLELESLQLRSRKEEHSESSLNRLLDSNLHLVVKHPNEWSLPETELVEGETLKQVSARFHGSLVY